MLWFKILLPLLAQMDSVEAIESDEGYEDEIVVLEESLEEPFDIYEVEFNDEDELDAFGFEDEITCP